MIVHTKTSDQAHVSIGVRSYPIVHPDRYALQLLSTVLGGGMSSRLFTEVRERRGLAYYVYGVNNSYTDAGSLYSQAGVDINRIDEAVEDDRARDQADRRGACAGRRAREGEELREGSFRVQLESPHGTIMFGLRREVLEGHATEPATCSRDSTRHRQDLKRVSHRT